MLQWKKKMSAYNDGYRAYYNRVDKNPYNEDIDPDEYAEWETGYDFGFAEDCQEEFGDDTD